MGFYASTARSNADNSTVLLSIAHGKISSSADLAKIRTTLDVTDCSPVAIDALKKVLISEGYIIKNPEEITKGISKFNENIIIIEW